MNTARVQSSVLFNCAILALSAFILFIESAEARVIPSDVRLCHKYDPNVDLCLQKLFENLRPRLIRGIPEVGLPPLDPLQLTELDVSLGRQGKIWFSDVKITGVRSFVLNYIRTEIKRLEVSVSITFPVLQYEGHYEIDGRFMHFNLKGKGTIKGNATGVTSNADMKGKIKRHFDGERYVEFTSAYVNVTLKDYGIRIEELFSDKSLNDKINVLLNDKDSRYRKFSILTAKPIIDRVTSRMVLEVVNGIAKNYSFDEVFA